MEAAFLRNAKGQNGFCCTTSQPCGMTTTLQSALLINDFADFLATGPSRGSILEWRPSEKVVDRYDELVAKRNDGSITTAEWNEAQSLLSSEILLSQIKA